MISQIRRLTDIARRRIGGGKGPERRTDLPLDHQLTFNPSPDQRWTYEERRGININDVDVRELVRESANDVGVLCGVSHGLYTYQQFVWSKGGKGLASFNGEVNALQHTLLGRLGNIYDGLTGGISFELDEDGLWLNNVHVRSVMKLYVLRPTEAARGYLEGLRDKVGLIISRRRTNSKYDAVHDEAMRLYDELTFVLSTVAPTGTPRLCA